MDDTEKDWAILWSTLSDENLIYWKKKYCADIADFTYKVNQIQNEIEKREEAKNEAVAT